MDTYHPGLTRVRSIRFLSFEIKRVRESYFKIVKNMNSNKNKSAQDDNNRIFLLTLYTILNNDINLIYDILN